MSDQDNIFTGTTNPETPEQNAPVQQAQPDTSVPKNDFADLLKSITAEDGRQKYSDVESALKSLPHAQQHISKLEQEMAELKAELEKRKTAEEIVSRIESSGRKQEEATPSKPAITSEQIEALVDKRLSAKEQFNKEQSNIRKVVDTMSKMYGEKSEEVFYSKAAEAGLDRAMINRLAAVSPEAAMRIVGKVEAGGIPPKTFSNTNSDAAFTNKPVPSAKLPPYPTTKDMVAAWKASKELI